MEDDSLVDDRQYRTILLGDPCCYCGARIAGQVDHIAPRFLGGEDGWENFTAACGRCNQSKNAKQLLTFLMDRLKPDAQPQPMDGVRYRRDTKKWDARVSGPSGVVLLGSHETADAAMDAVRVWKDQNAHVETPGEARTRRRIERDTRLAEKWNSGMTSREIATSEGVTESSIISVLNRIRDRGEIELARPGRGAPGKMRARRLAASVNVTDSPLERARLARGLSQAELAKLAGMSETAIRGLERGTQTARVGTRRKLAAALDLDEAALFGVRDQPAPSVTAGDDPDFPWMVTAHFATRAEAEAWAARGAGG